MASCRRVRENDWNPSIMDGRSVNLLQMCTLRVLDFGVYMYERFIVC